MTWRDLLRGLGEVLFPPVCGHCGGLAEGSGYRYLCPDCARRIDFVRPPCCEACGHPRHGGEECEHCGGFEPAYGRARSAVLFRGPACSLVEGLGRRGGGHLIRDVETVFRLSPAVLALARGAVLVPVPLHPRRRRERGQNPSELLARCLAKAAGGGARTALLLRRVADTPPLSALDQRARERLLKNAFALARGCSFTAGLRYLLVDDVFTTGSTLNSCARALRQAGCPSLDVVTFARG